MHIENSHQRTIAAPAAKVGELLDTAASSNDRIWPYENWSNIQFDRALQVGASGGHGVIRYEVIEYTPGVKLRFRFLKDLDGFHEIVIKEIDSNNCLLQHTIDANIKGKMLLLWPIVIRPLHNALIEDLMDKVELQVAQLNKPQKWGTWVKFLRNMRGMHNTKKPFNI